MTSFRCGRGYVPDAAPAAEPCAANAKMWAEHWCKRMRVRKVRRARLPAHHGNGAVALAGPIRFGASSTPLKSKWAPHGM